MELALKRIFYLGQGKNGLKLRQFYHSLRDFKNMDKTILVGGNKIRYLDWKGPNDDTIVMLHGFNQSAHSWDDFCPKVTSKFRVLALDQRGHGDSFIPSDGDYSMETMANDLHLFVKELKLGPFILVGMSMGARNSAYFAAQHPELVKSLVLVDWSPEPEGAGVAKIASFLKLEWKTFDEAVDVMLASNPTRTREGIEQRLKYTLKQLPSGKWSWKVDRETWMKFFNRRQSEDQTAFIQKQWDSLKLIKAPTLLIKGEMSDVLSKEKAEKVLKTIQNCQAVVVPKAGHSVAGDNPDGFYSAVIKFLSTNAHL